MKKSRLSEVQMVKILKQHESGVSVKELCKEYGVSAATFYNWKSKYGEIYKYFILIAYLVNPARFLTLSLDIRFFR